MESKFHLRIFSFKWVPQPRNYFNIPEKLTRNPKNHGLGRCFFLFQTWGVNFRFHVVSFLGVIGWVVPLPTNSGK